MDGKNLKTDSNFLLKKCAGRCHGGVDMITELPDENGVDMIITELPDENGVDRISKLPDEIIIFILSFLSLREATSTSVLSSRWSDLWKYTSNLNFNTKLIKAEPGMQLPWELKSYDVEKCKYVQMVNSVLQLHKALTLKEFKISLYINESAQEVVSKWVEFLFSRQVERLELDFLCGYDMDKVSLEDLLRDSKACMPQADVILFKSLKTLCLKCFKLSGEDIDLFLRNCPLLEQLSIQHTLLTSDVVVCGTTLMLEHLDIYSCSGEISIKVSAPKLTWLRVYTKAENNLLLENLPKLIVVDFTCTSPTQDDAKRFASAVFRFISRWKFLSLTLQYPKVFLANGFPRMPNLKRLEIRYCGEYALCLLPLSALIWASPRLQEFKFEFIYMGMPRHLLPLEDLPNVTRPPHQHLEVFNFQGFCLDDPSHYKLVTYISNNCVTLKKIIISFPFYEHMPGLTEAELQITKGVEEDSHLVETLLRRDIPDHIELHFVI